MTAAPGKRPRVRQLRVVVRDARIRNGRPERDARSRHASRGRDVVSFEGSDGWRGAGADRLNVSPSLTWIMDENARVTVHQTFNRDRFDGDGGVPFNITDLPSYRPELRFSLPQDNVLVEDSQTHVLFNGNLSPAWEFRNAFFAQRTSDRYFVTEGVYGDPENNLVYREPLDFHHTRRPIQNQVELLGHVDGFGRHNLLFGYEYQRDCRRGEGADPEPRTGVMLTARQP